MKRLSMCTACCLAWVLAVGSAAASPEQAGQPIFHFELAYDASTGTSSAFIYGTLSRADIAAVKSWRGKLPVGYAADVGGSFVPTRLLGHLRDQLQNSTAPERDAALNWILDRMGSYSAMPTSSIPESVLSLVLGKEKSYWCGERTMPDGHCSSNCTASDNPRTCSGCGCAGEKTWPD